eukprot:15453632-Alexandrium_andersonii.AAC.1
MCRSLLRIAIDEHVKTEVDGEDDGSWRGPNVRMVEWWLRHLYISMLRGSCDPCPDRQLDVMRVRACCNT